MSEQEKPFIINDRRKFRADGELREPTPEPKHPTEIPQASTPANAPNAHDSGARVIPIADARDHNDRDHNAAPAPRSSGPIPINSAHLVTPVPEPVENAGQTSGSRSTGDPDAPEDASDDTLPAPPTAEEAAQVKLAYEATADRLETVMRATNPGAEHMPPMDFSRLVQSVYMSAMMQLGAGTTQGEQARVDLLGAKQSIDMLNVIGEKAGDNLNGTETRLIESALFELRMGFLEITQLLARQAQTKQGAPGISPFGAAPGTGPAGPRIVT